MLPFLRKKDAGIAGMTVKIRKPDEKDTQDQNDPQAAIHACAQDLITAVHNKDVQGVADALYDAFDIMEEMPNQEPKEAIEPHSYEASKED